MKNYLLMILIISGYISASESSTFSQSATEDIPKTPELQLGDWCYKHFMSIYEGVYQGNTKAVNEEFSNLSNQVNTVELEPYTQLSTIELIIKRWKASGRIADEDREKVAQMLSHVVKINATVKDRKLTINDRTIELLCTNGFCKVVSELVHQVDRVQDKDIEAILTLGEETRTKCLNVLIARNVLTPEQRESIQPYIQKPDEQPASPSILRRLLGR